ncbi:MAG: hypothetical protein M1822_009292 [Bathelium mastoideum]|nr:MAG: hypothetical protein M1822_009292 [Bathelium mastoideum]
MPSSPTPSETRREETQSEKASRLGNQSLSARNAKRARANSAILAVPWSGPSLTESFGYFEDSDCNTLALIRKASHFFPTINLGLACHDSPRGSSPALTPEAVEEAHSNIDRIPERQILDFLVQYFVAEVNWVDQVVHSPWLLAKYQSWWTVERVRLVTEVDFAILILRICSYASQFLPSPGYILDKIRGVLLTDVRNTCDEIADSLEAISTAADGQGSLIRIQHLAFLGLRYQVEGKTAAFWEVLGRAIRVAQSVGIQGDGARARQGIDEIDQEMERRTFCNLYIWDSLLSRQLDRIAFLPRCLRPGDWPQLHILGSEGGSAGGESEEQGGDAPRLFTERVLQARLADFWRSNGHMQGTEYDMVRAEERYDKFCREYLSQLHPAFALVDPDETWDKRLPKLPLQRQLLHIAIYDSLCWNFRPLLLRRLFPLPRDQDRTESLPLPSYKRMLLSSQGKALAVAALRALDGVTQLHALLGGYHTRFAGLVFSTFEAAVLLLCLCMDPLFPSNCHNQHVPQSSALSTKTDTLQAGIYNVTRHGCIQAVQGALKRLRMLAEVSSMADVGANILTRLLSKALETDAGTGAEVGMDEVMLSQNQEVGNLTTRSSQLGATTTVGEVGSWATSDPTDLHSVSDFMSMSVTSAVGDMTSWPPFDPSNINSRDDFVSISTTQDRQNNWATPIVDFSH